MLSSCALAMPVGYTRYNEQLSHQPQPQLPESARLRHHDFADRLLHITELPVILVLFVFVHHRQYWSVNKLHQRSN